MNRNRFMTPPPPYNNDNQLNPISFQVPIHRFNVWQNNLQPNPNLPAAYALPQVQPKNYCSTCEVWTTEPYNAHQSSASHMAKKACHRTNQNYQPPYCNQNINSPNNNNLNSNNNNLNSSKKKKRSRRNNQINRQDNNDNFGNDSYLIENQVSILPTDEKNEINISLTNNDSQSNETVNLIKSKGQEMLIPVNGTFCALCEIFFPDKDFAENEHCSSDAHCEAYEKLLKKVQDVKCDKRPLENTSEESPSDKRLKLDNETGDRDFRIETNKTVDQTPDQTTVSRDLDELDKNSNHEFNAPDFSLEFPDDLEDYDEGEIRSDAEM